MNYINDNRGVNVTAEWLTQFKCCYDGLGDSRVEDYATMLNYAQTADKEIIYSNTSFWTYPNVTY